jgi:hypothetical protein
MDVKDVKQAMNLFTEYGRLKDLESAIATDDLWVQKEPKVTKFLSKNTAVQNAANNWIASRKNDIISTLQALGINTTDIDS